MEYSLFKDFVVIFVLAALVIFICQRLRVPTIIGFLVTGVIAGPNGLALVRAAKDVDAVADVGVVLLLFAIGIEFSIRRLTDIKRAVLIGGAVQIIATAIGVMGFYRLPGGSTAALAFVGIIIAMSSPALVLKKLSDRSEINTPHGQAALGILFFQGMCLIPAILLAPLFARGALGSGIMPYLVAGKIVGIMLVVIVGMKWVVPFVLDLAARFKSREFFMMVIIAVCLLMAWAAHQAGLPAGLAAFLAGLVLSETEYGLQAFPGMKPLRAVCAGLFFVTIGMLLNPAIFVQRPGTIITLTLGVVALKIAAGTVAVVALRYPLQNAVLAGLALFQVGEFAFVLSRYGVKYNIFTSQGFQIFLAISAITMAVTPFAMMLAPALGRLIGRLPLPRRLVDGAGVDTGAALPDLSDHLVVIGHGLTGKNLARAARTAGIPYAVIDANLDTVRSARAQGEPAVFGDASHAIVLERARIRTAKVVALTFDDFVTARRVAEQARALNPLCRIIARSHHFDHIQPLREHGVSRVIPEDFEISVLLFASVLSEYQIPRRTVETIVNEVRADEYGVFRNLSRKEIDPDAAVAPEPPALSEVAVTEESGLAGRSMRQLPVGKKQRLHLLALCRDGKITAHPGADTKLATGDILYLVSEDGRRVGPSDLRIEK